MKQRITAIIERITIDEDVLFLTDQPSVELEFSAIDTGGGFHDPILDFEFKLAVEKREVREQTNHNIILMIRDPADRENTLSLAYQGKLKQVDGRFFRGMGRLQDEHVSRDTVKFIMRCLRQ